MIQAPSETEKDKLIQDAKALFGGDLISFEDIIMVKNTDDLKVAEQLLAYRIKRRREQQMKEAMQREQQNAEVQIQSASAAEEEKRKTLMLDFALKATLEELKREGDASVNEARDTAQVSHELIKQYFNAAINSQQQTLRK